MWMWKARALWLGSLLLDLAVMMMMLVAAAVACCWASVEGGAREKGWLSVMGVTMRQKVVVVVVLTWMPWLSGLRQLAEG
jgi:hypothetical protein